MPADAVQERRLIGVLFGLLLLALWPTLVSFPSTWNVSYQEQGFFVGGLVAWLVWRDRGIVLRAVGQGLSDLVPIVALLSVAWMLAVIMNVRSIHQLLFAGLLTAWGLASFGGAARRPILVMGLTFLLGVPFWSVSMPFLQRATVIASGAATRVAGISAEVGYDFITISTGTFLVQSGCSGINYLMGGLVLGAFYQFLDAAYLIAEGSLRGAGDTRWPFVVEMALGWGLLLPAAYLLGVVLEGGLMGAWYGGTLYVAVLAAAFLWRFRSGAWQRIRI